MRIRYFLAALMLGIAAPAAAGPFAEVGDRQLRQDVETLHAAGLIEGPIDSWPLPWAQIDAGVARAQDGRQLDPYLKAAANRLDRLGDFAAQRVAVEMQLSATNLPSVARDFGTLARARGDASGKVEFNGDNVSISLGAGVRSGQIGKAYNFEPSMIAVRLGNWSVYGGWTQEWFGPGQDGALLFSNSTRPFPKIGIKRLMPDPIDLPILRWLGPIRLDLFGGVLDERRRDYDNILTFGTRLSFAPTPRLEIGLNRMQQLCGKGRPCGLKQIAQSFIGVGNADNPTPGSVAAFLNQAGNQIAGFDISYTRRFGSVTTKFYFEAEAEDSQHIIIEQFARMIGTHLSGPWGSQGASWTANIEYTDTQAAQFFHGTPLEKVFSSEKIYTGALYNNSLYTAGFSYNNLPIGYWTDGDARNLAFAGSLTDTSNRRWYASVRSVHLNINNVGNPPRGIALIPNQFIGFYSYRTSFDSEKFAILTGGAEIPTKFGDLRVEARWQSDSPNTPGVTKPRAALELQLRERF